MLVLVHVVQLLTGVPLQPTLPILKLSFLFD